MCFEKKLNLKRTFKIGSYFDHLKSITKAFVRILPKDFNFKSFMTLTSPLNHFQTKFPLIKVDVKTLLFN